MKRLWVIAALLACSCRAQDAGAWWNALAADGAAELPNYWNPTNLGSKLVLWFDASDNSTLLSSDGTPCTDGEYVVKWENKAVSTNDLVSPDNAWVYRATQAVANNKPAIEAVAGYGLLMDYALCPRTVFIVCAYGTGVETTWDGPRNLFYRSLSVRIGAAYNTGSNQDWVAAPNLFDGVASKNGATPTTVALALPFTVLRFDIRSSFTSFDRFNLGGTTAARQWNGPISEVIWTDAYMTSEEIQKTTTYLMNKWGITP